MDFSSWPHTIWIQTLGLLKPGWVEISTDCTSQTSFSCSPNLIALKQYHSLNSVCHKFRDALERCPKRPTTLALCRATLEPIYSNLLRWLQANRYPQFLTCYTEGALQLMLHPFMSIYFDQLKAISLACATNTSFTDLSRCTSITHCQLHAPSERVLNVKAVAELPRLQCLTLQAGSYECLPLSPLLTSLVLRQSLVQCDRGTTGTLRDLAVTDNSHLYLHNKGLADCTALTKLSFVNYSNIFADRYSDIYRFESCPPVAMRRLVHLSDKTVPLVKRKVSLGQFGARRKLCRLHLLLRGTSYLTGGSASLTSLTQLKIHVLPKAGEEPRHLHLIPAADIRVNWGRMYSLVSFVLIGPARFSSSILQVCCLSQLTQFVLVGFKPGDQQTAQYVETVPDHFATQRADVKVCISELET